MKDKLQVHITAEQLYRKKLMMRISSLVVAAALVVLSILYIMLYIVNQTGNFTISLDPNLKAVNNILMSDKADFSTSSSILKVDALEYMDNITESWIPSYVTEKDGDNSKDNYLAYTFYVKNKGEDTINYVREVKIQSVIKRVDEAVRFALYVNGEKTVYAKLAKNGEIEPNSVAFYSNHQVLKEDRLDFKPGDIDKYTVLIWLEGEDPECIDDIKGGEMKMLMQITELEKK